MSWIRQYTGKYQRSHQSTFLSSNFCWYSYVISFWYILFLCLWDCLLLCYLKLEELFKWILHTLHQWRAKHGSPPPRGSQEKILGIANYKEIDLTISTKYKVYCLSRGRDNILHKRGDRNETTENSLRTTALQLTSSHSCISTYKGYASLHSLAKLRKLFTLFMLC